MRSKELEARSISEVTEDRAQRCQLSWHCLGSHTPIATEERGIHLMQLLTPWQYLMLVLFIGLPASLCAQKAKGSWSDLKDLKSGQGIEVIESSMKSHHGQFVDVTDQVLIVQEGGADVSIRREDVVRVSTGSAPRRGEHALVGLVVGGAIGAGIGAASGSAHGFLGGSSRGISSLVGIVIGAPSGALIGAVIPAHTTIYRAAPDTLDTASP
jgi:hypothetical protein